MMISKLKRSLLTLISILKKNRVIWFLIKLTFGLAIIYLLQWIGRKEYRSTLDSGQNCYCKTDSIYVDHTAGYIDQIGYIFTDFKNEQRVALYPKDTTLSDFNFSRTYTVKYLCDNPRYKELILEDWDKSKYKVDNFGRYLLTE